MRQTAITLPDRYVLGSNDVALFIEGGDNGGRQPGNRQHVVETVFLGLHLLETDTSRDLLNDSALRSIEAWMRSTLALVQDHIRIREDQSSIKRAATY